MKDIMNSLNFKKDLLGMLEALIFASQEAISTEKLHDILKQHDEELTKKEVEAALYELENLWQDKGLSLKKLAGGYVFATSEKYAFLIQKLMQDKPIQISKGQLEVLAIVAYRQPITRVDVDQIRGVDSSFAIKRLMQLNLLKILGKSEGLGRALLYGTTKYFLEFFALGSLNDLPSLKQYESLGDDEQNNEEVLAQNITIKDLFDSAQENPMFSEKTKRLSDDALKSLDEALLNIDDANKNFNGENIG